MKFSIFNRQSPIASFPRRRCGAEIENWKLKIGNARRRAFTLIEIMVAIAVFTMVIGAIYASWMALMRSSQVAREPEIFPRNGKFINPNTGRDFNLRRVTFGLEAAEEGEKNLVLRQNPVLMDPDADEQKYPLVLARNVRKFTVECWDTNKLDWAAEWLDTNSIPALLRVNLVLGGNVTAGAAAPDFSVARIFSLPSQTMPAAVQNGTINSGTSANRLNSSLLNSLLK